MKKTFLLLVALVATVVGTSAQGQTATLQQGDKMTPFYGRDAFRQAYNAAPQKGGVITLSAGTFNQVDSVMKQVKIIGNGYKENKTVIDSTLYVKADNVTVEGVDVKILSMNNTNHLTIRHCKIYNLQKWAFCNRGITHKNTIVDQCVISTDLAIKGGENYCLKNSFVNLLFYSSQGNGNKAYVANCVFGTMIGDYGLNVMKAVFKNNLIFIWVKDIFNYDDSVGAEFYNNLFFEGVNIKVNGGRGGIYSTELSIDLDTRSKTPELNHEETLTWKNNAVASYDDVFGDSDEENPLYAPIITTFKGDDGTVVGPYGGTGFTENPGIPRIVESKIDSNTDADGKLNVKIKVEVNQ